MQRRAGGFTLIELVTVIVILAIFIGLSAIALDDWMENQRTKAAARSLADLMQVARQEAIRTNDDHAVYFDRDPAGAPLNNSNGERVAALAIRDADGDGLPDAGEYLASIPFDPTQSIAWGSAFAQAPGSEVPAPNDNPAAAYPLADPCCSFTRPDDTPARWIVFRGDGLPRAFRTVPFAVGDVGTGSGTIYITSGTRDYAVVLTALGGVRVHPFDAANGQWKQ